jgi:ethanolamine utilization protein EutQ (cupin superfamily)
MLSWAIFPAGMHAPGPRNVLGWLFSTTKLDTNQDSILYSEKNDADKPISCGLYRLEKGTPLVYEYTYHEMKIILEGEFEISDETGQKVTAKPGDVFYFPKGAKITFTTPSYGLAFYVCSDILSVLILERTWY